MNFHVEITARGERDRDECFQYIVQFSPEGALRWLDAFQAAVRAMRTEPHFGRAPESDDCQEDIRQKFFKTPHGRVYRLLFVVRGDTIYLIHVRGPGQDLLDPGDVQLPGNGN